MSLAGRSLVQGPETGESRGNAEGCSKGMQPPPRHKQGTRRWPSIALRDGRLETLVQDDGARYSVSFELSLRPRRGRECVKETKGAWTRLLLMKAQRRGTDYRRAGKVFSRWTPSNINGLCLVVSIRSSIEKGTVHARHRLRAAIASAAQRVENKKFICGCGLETGNCIRPPPYIPSLKTKTLLRDPFHVRIFLLQQRQTA